VVCPCQEFLKWHARECLLGQCEHCGVENLLIYPISWKHFSLEEIVTKKGEENKELKLVYKSMSPLGSLII
jgi:hypothetical protein